MTLELFAGIAVREIAAAREWYARFFGRGPDFEPNDIEAVWILAEGRNLYIIEDAGRAGHAVQTLIVDDLDERLTDLASRGLETDTDETYENGTRKVTYRDPDGNELGIAAA